VGLVVLGKREAGGQVLLEEGSLGGLKILSEDRVHRLLQGNAVSAHGLLGGALGEERLGISLLDGVASHKGLVGDLGDINAGDIDLGAGGNGVDLVNALKRHAVDLVGAGDQDESGFELLEENNSLSAEPTGEEDKDAAGGNATSELSGFRLLGADASLLVISGVPLELFDH